MKFEKAKVTIINLGDQDILTCSGYDQKSFNCYNPYNNTNTKNTKKASHGWGWGWFGGWFGGWWF